MIIGNPPYNATQRYWNDFNPNRALSNHRPTHPRNLRSSQRSAKTCTSSTTCTSGSSAGRRDRLADDGIIGFVTNRAYLDSRQDDGFRQIAAQEFTDIYVLDLGSDVRRNPKISGTTHNVFGIQTGVACRFLCTRRSQVRVRAASITHDVRMRSWRPISWSIFVTQRSRRLSSTESRRTPKPTGSIKSNSDFEQLVPIANKDAKALKKPQIMVKRCSRCIR